MHTSGVTNTVPKLGARFGVGEENSAAVKRQKQDAYFRHISMGAAEANKHKRCGKCFYGTNVQGHHACQYISIAGHRRPCPADFDDVKCTEFLPLEGNEELAKQINEQLVKEFYFGGKIKNYGHDR